MQGNMEFVSIVILKFLAKEKDIHAAQQQTYVNQNPKNVNVKEVLTVQKVKNVVRVSAKMKPKIAQDVFLEMIQHVQLGRIVVY